MITTDTSISFWLAGLLFFGLGLVLGCITAYVVIGRQSRTRELEEELIALREKFSDYRDQVSQHFMRTSELVQEMTMSYRAVYEHLAAGAQNLCNGGPEAQLANLPGHTRLSDGGNESIPADGEPSNSDVYLDGLPGEAPRISDLDIRAEREDDSRFQH